MHPNATSEHISKALNDPNQYVRRQAIEHPNATPEHISKALNDPDDFVRQAAIRHSNAAKPLNNTKIQKSAAALPSKRLVKKSFKSHIDTMPSLEP